MNKKMSLINRIGNKIIRNTNWYQRDFWKGVTKFWNLNRFDLDIVNLGSGAGVHAFNYTNCNVIGANLALAPQSLVHDYAILRNYFSFLKEGGVVVITVCPFSCLISQYGKEHNFRYYTILHPATITGFDDSERTRALMIKNNPFKAMSVYCIKKTLTEYLKILKNKFFTRTSQPDLQQSANAIINGWKRQFGIHDFKGPLSEKHKKEQLQRKQTLIEMIDFCKERSLKPVIVIPPMHPTLSSQFPPEFIKNYIQDFMEGVKVPIYDYMYSEEFASDQYYASALFLNDKGSKFFTKKLIDRLMEDNKFKMY